MAPEPTTPAPDAPSTAAPRSSSRTVETSGSGPDAGTAAVAPAKTKKRSALVNDGPTGRARREERAEERAAEAAADVPPAQ